LYVDYHDREWGFATTDDTRLFEKICLEGFQAGLNWLTILRKRESFREAFHGFRIERVAAMTGRQINRLLRNPDIVRHRGKIESTINNARRALEMIETEGSLAEYIWQYARQVPTQRRMTWRDAARPVSPASITMSSDLKRRGWTFVGPTTMHAFMQAMGLFNHHLTGCHVRDQAQAARARVRATAQP
jgi:DNA-3-methyladenine glycosylase I